ncbi:MAG: DUF4368 domain-containing protein [Ruminococcaceae bacterium]|nr:DUF4368 domain-containing protein [Oscillospiraceae bacterium]
MKQQYNTALYLRLSRDDELKGESGSISTQRTMLTQYCKEQKMRIVGEYVDDGWSGTNFDRPSFQRMIDDIEDGKINCVITKDLSRLGRNYILTGQYTEIYFPSKGVRYIALNDGVDTEKGESEIAPFLNILNEMHARQTSKKVKAALNARFRDGAHMCNMAPIGYKKHPEIKGKLIPDEDTRWIVEKIFDLAAHGVGAAKICKTLSEEHIPTPAYINYQKYGLYAHLIEGRPESKRYDWIVSQVKNLLKNEVYIGNSIHYKQSTISFKNKKLQRKPEEEWLRIEGTHEPIISQEVWEQAQAHINSRKRSSKNGETQIFAGLIKCSDCGKALRLLNNKSGSRTTVDKHYMCSTFSTYGKEKCSIHYIQYKVLYAVVLERLRYWIKQAQADENKLLARLKKSDDKQRDSEIAHSKKELVMAEKRLKDLDNLFVKMYEDRANGTVTERNFAMLSEKYQQEQIKLEDQLEVLRNKLQSSEQDKDAAEHWVKLIRKYTDLTELTAPLLNELIEKIVVYEGVKDDNGNRTQEVDIYYRFVGMID